MFEWKDIKEIDLKYEERAVFWIFQTREWLEGRFVPDCEIYLTDGIYTICDDGYFANGSNHIITRFARIPAGDEPNPIRGVHDKYKDYEIKLDNNLFEVLGVLVNAMHDYWAAIKAALDIT